ncbi:uncharacterized protein LOC117322308 isoform X3 [Pecten maximus]|uniref:uncharacterized protein LOC117322308 isoform X3 n=1 Tax=Pecten maximus TaxID=6579 RepID=UPI00145801EF|nr:uncharacterized protein LOC117322308 isoform X3 [Pecten maximus]
MDPTPEALPDPVPPTGQKNELIDFSKDDDQTTDLGCVGTNPFSDSAPGEMHTSDPYREFQSNDVNTKNTEQIAQSALKYDAPEFFPEQRSTTDCSPLRHDAPEFLSRNSQQADMFDQNPHSGGLESSDSPQLPQSNTCTPKEQAHDVMGTQCKENVPVLMEDWNVPTTKTEQGDGDVDDYEDEEDYSESESNSQVENDEIIEDDYTDSEEDTENIQDDVMSGTGEGTELADVHPEFDQSAIKHAFNENELQFQQQGGGLMPSMDAEPLLVEGGTEQELGDQTEEIGSRQMDIGQESMEHQQVASGDLSRDTISKSDTFTIESDSDMEKRSITPPVEENKGTGIVVSDQHISGFQDNQSNQEIGGASTPFGENEMEQTMSQKEKENIFASDMESGPAGFCGDDNDMFTKQPTVQLEPENKQQAVLQDEQMSPLKQDFYGETQPSQVHWDEPMIPQQDASPLELSPARQQTGYSDDVASPRDVLLEETSKQGLQMDESGVDQAEAEPNRQQPQDLVPNPVFTQQNQEYDDEGEDEGTYPDDQNSEDEEEFINDEEEEEMEFSSEERFTHPQQQKLTSEERSVSPQEERMSVEKELVSPQNRLASEERSVSSTEQDLNEFKQSQVSTERSVSPEIKNSFASEERSVPHPEDQCLYTQNPFEEQGAYEEKQPTSQSFEKESYSFEHDMEPEKKDKPVIDETFGMAPTPFKALEQESVLPPGQAFRLEGTAGDAKDVGKPSEDILTAGGVNDFDQIEHGQKDDFMTAEGVNDFAQIEHGQKEDLMTTGGVNDFDQNVDHGQKENILTAGGVNDFDQNVEHGQKEDILTAGGVNDFDQNVEHGQKENILTAGGVNDFDQNVEHGQKEDFMTAEGVNDFDQNVEHGQKEDILTAGGVNDFEQIEHGQRDKILIAGGVNDFEQNVEHGQREDILTAGGVNDFDQNVEHGQKEDILTAGGVNDFDQNVEHGQKEDILTAGSVNDFDQNVGHGQREDILTAGGVNDFDQNVEHGQKEDILTAGGVNDFDQNVEHGQKEDILTAGSVNDFDQNVGHGQKEDILTGGSVNDFDQNVEHGQKEDILTAGGVNDFDQNVEHGQRDAILTAGGGSYSDENLSEQFDDEDVAVQQNVKDDNHQPVSMETVSKESNEERKEILEPGIDIKETGMTESFIMDSQETGMTKSVIMDSQEIDDQPPSEVSSQMVEDDGDMGKLVNESMEGPAAEISEIATSPNECSMVLKETVMDNDASSLSQPVSTKSALEEYIRDPMEDVENRQEQSLEAAEVEQPMVTEDVREVEVTGKDEVVAPTPVSELPEPPANQQAVEQKLPESVPEPLISEKVAEEKKEPLEIAGKDKGTPVEKEAKKIAEPAEKKIQLSEKSERKDAKPKKQEKPITKTPQKPLRKPKEKTPPKHETSKIPSPTKTENRTTKPTTRTARPSKAASPRTLDVKPSTDKPPFDTRSPRAVSVSSQRIPPLSQTPTTPSPTKVPSKKLSTKTQSKEATESFLERMSRPRCRTPKKDGTSDSGFEENKTPRAASATSPRKKYGIDAKNDSYKPGGGNVKITDQKVTVRHVGSKIDARSKTPTSTQRDSTPRTPKGPTPDTKNVQSKIGSLKNATHTPGGGNVKIANQKKDYSAVQGKIGSKVNLDHRPKGGDKKILSKKLEWKAESRVGSLDNAKHAPGGGKVKIETAKLDFKEKAASKVGSKDNMDHKAGGGDKKIETKKLDFKEKAASKIGSKDNATHKPGGGEKKIENHKLTFKESARPRTDTGGGPVTSPPQSKSPSLKSPRPDSGISHDSLPEEQES